METYHLIQGALFIALAADVWLLLLLYQKGLRNLSEKLLFLHIFGVLLWTASVLTLLNFESIVATKLAFFAAAFSALSKYCFAVSFPYNKITFSVSSVLILIVGLLAMAASFMPDALFTNLDVVNKTYGIRENGFLSTPYSLLMVYLLLAPVFILLFKRRHLNDNHTKAQTTYLAVGIALFFTISLTTNVVLPSFFGVYYFNGFGPVFSILMVAFMVYIITRHQFLELQIALQRGLVYSLALIFIAGLYVGTLAFVSTLNVSGEISSVIGGFITTVIGIITVPRLDTYLRRKTDRWFFKDRYNYNQAVYDLATSLQSSLELDTLLQTSEVALADILRATRVTIVPTSAVPERTPEDSMVPIKMQQKISGYIIVGPKRSGDSYTSEDHQLLETFAAQAGTAMSRAFLYQEIKRYARGLEEKVAERTKELAATQEEQRQMMLQLSHELQTPLAVLQTQLSDIKKAAQRETDVAPLERTLKRVSHFIQDLLRLARLEQQTAVPEKRPVAIDQAVAEALEEIEIIAESKDITITRAIQPGVTVALNQRDLHEIIMNLASNAIKYMKPAGDKRIAFTLKATSDEVLLEITDTGIGIAPSEIENIFARFYRAKNGSERVGTGLGLAITKQLVERNGGSIAVSSVLGEGTTFTVTFLK